jgi:hypothetical protein
MVSDHAVRETEGLQQPAIGVPPSSLPRVRLLLNDLRTQQLVDLSLERGATIVVLVNRPRQLDEPRPEIPVTLADPDLVLDVPERFVDSAKIGRQRHQLISLDY